MYYTILVQQICVYRFYMCLLNTLGLFSSLMSSRLCRRPLAFHWSICVAIIIKQNIPGCLQSSDLFLPGILGSSFAFKRAVLRWLGLWEAGMEMRCGPPLMGETEPLVWGPNSRDLCVPHQHCTAQLRSAFVKQMFSLIFSVIPFSMQGKNMCIKGAHHRNSHSGVFCHSHVQRDHGCHTLPRWAVPDSSEIHGHTPLALKAVPRIWYICSGANFDVTGFYVLW